MMNLNKLSKIADSISNILELENISTICPNIEIKLLLNNESLQLIDRECFNLTKREKPYQQGDIINVKIGNIQFTLDKKEEIK